MSLDCETLVCSSASKIRTRLIRYGPQDTLSTDVAET
jgi:hypothetical protein